MNKKNLPGYIWALFIIVVLIGISFWWYSKNVTIESITITSPHNYAFQEEVKIDLDKPASIYIRYWKDGSQNIYRTIKTTKKESHIVPLLLLETGTTYKYQVVINRFINISSKIFSFHQGKSFEILSIHSSISSNEKTSERDSFFLLCVIFDKYQSSFAQIL